MIRLSVDDQQMSEHCDLLERHRRVMPTWLNLYYEDPIELVSGKDCFVADAEGNEYIDFFGGILTTSIGYNVDEFVEAVRTQAGRMVHTSTLYLIRPMVELAERIAGLSGIPDAKVFFVSSGSEAVDTALMMCCTARRTNQVLALRNSYHGRSFAAVGVTGNRSWSPVSFGPLSVSWIHNGDSLRGVFAGLSGEELCHAAADDLREVMATTTAGDIACLIAEPIQGVGGFVVPPDGFLGALQEVLAERGILYVSDEVQTGWGRTGEHFWGYQAHGVRPDLLVFAKGLGNGLAIGGVVGRASIVDSFESNSISTFGGNPLAATGALATLDYIAAHNLQANAQAVGTRLRTQLAEGVAGLPMVADVRGKGLMIGVELVIPGTTRPDAGSAIAVLQAARDTGVLVGRGGLYGNVLRISPPMSVTPAVADDGARRVLSALRKVSGKQEGSN
ncbi:MAG: aspartate aminotransferase family protein [Actinobacteria bacterium]|jgi:4-aminobutyrate aminotransferase|nr:aspartate aminotransferase family protein [Actinomycetota bacterium]